MESGYLIDSNAIIDFCNGKLPAKGRELMFSIEQPNISIITHIEIFGLSDIGEKEEKALKDFIAISSVYPVGMEVAEKTIEIRKKARVKLPDAIIAATALLHDFELITRNLTDFSKISALKVINPHTL